jgi:alkanesulfonate monooxygenase SsuD/methylene tetrahydromethanopterin reductase-like flavin-dependent oxidoreductase (luciferase family)
MKVGLMAVVFGRVQGMGVMKAFASHAERLGFSTLWAPEHVVLVDQYQSQYPTLRRASSRRPLMRRLQIPSSPCARSHQ